MTNTLHFEQLHDGRTQVRSVVATIEQEMAILSGKVMRDGAHASQDQLLASWATLVELLALGPAPATRVCPVCAHVGMVDATCCGYCWTKVAPPAVAAGQ